MDPIDEEYRRKALWAKWERLETTFKHIMQSGRSIIQNPAPDGADAKRQMVITYATIMKDLITNTRPQLSALIKETVDLILESEDGQ